LDFQFGGEFDLAEVFSVWADGVGVAVVDVLEASAHDARETRHESRSRWVGRESIEKAAFILYFNRSNIRAEIL
jgi:hypothetical protein